MTNGSLPPLFQGSSAKPTSWKLKWILRRKIARLILAQGLFDPAYYRCRYPDVSSAGSDLFSHYMKHGIFEDRSPSEAFCPSRYYEANADIAQTDNAIIHYLLDKRRPRPTPPRAASLLAPYLDSAISKVEMDHGSEIFEIKGLVRNLHSDVVAVDERIKSRELEAERHAALIARAEALEAERHAALIARTEALEAERHAALIARAEALEAERHAALIARTEALEAERHAALIARAEALEAERHAALIARTEALEAERHTALIARTDALESMISDGGGEMRKVTSLVKDLHSDVVAIGNRFRSHELQAQTHRAVSARVDVLESMIHEGGVKQRFVEIESRQDNNNLRFDHLERSVQDLLRACGTIHDNVDKIERSNLAVEDEHITKTEPSRTQAELAVLRDHIAELQFRLRLYVSPTNSGAMILKHHDLVSDHIARQGSWDEHVIEVMTSVARSRRGSAVDIGGHFGALTLPMARHFDSVHVFEPNDFSFFLLQSNIALNNLSNVCAHNVPLFSSQLNMALGDAELQESSVPTNEIGELDPVAAPNLASYVFVPRSSGTYVHTARPLDSFDLTDVAFIKIDAQGADGEIIMGALETIKSSRPVIVFEWENELARNFSVELTDVRATLEGLGYVVHVLKKHNAKQVDYIAYPTTYTPQVMHDRQPSSASNET